MIFSLKSYQLKANEELKDEVSFGFRKIEHKTITSKNIVFYQWFE